MKIKIDKDRVFFLIFISVLFLALLAVMNTMPRQSEIEKMNLPPQIEKQMRLHDEGMQ